MFRNQRFRVGRGALQGGQRLCAADIAQGHADIAQESAPFGPRDRRSRKSRPESRFVQRQQFHQLRRFQSGPAMLRHHRTRPRKTIPRADGQTIVAPENPVAYSRAQFHRDGPFQLDGQIRNAAARVQLEGRDDGGCGAGVQAAPASSAMIPLRRVRRQFERGNDLRQKKPVAQLPADEVRMFADETQSSPLRQIPLQQRPRVHVPQRARPAAAQFGDMRRQNLEPRANHLVIIGKARVTGDFTGRIWNISRIAHRQRNDAPRRRQHLTRLDSFGGAAFQVSHLPVAARFQPMLKLRRGIRRPGGGEPARVEAQFQRPFPNGGLHFFHATWY